MRPINLRTATALALILPVLMTNATAQEKKDQRGAAPAAHAAPAAPVQRAAPPAPAPHIAAPVAAAPRMAAPAPHFTAPAARIAAPAQQQHIAAPAQQQQRIAAPAHISTPHIAAQQISRPTPNMARGNGAHPNAVTSVTRQNSVARQQQIQAHGDGASAGRHDLTRHGGPTNSKVATPNNPNIATPTATSRNKTLPNTAASKLATPSKTIPNAALPNTATPSVLGKGPGNRGRNAASQQAQAKAQEQAQTQARAQIYGAGHRPVLQNQSFANGSTRDPAMRALARATFQGRFSQFRSRDRFADRRGFHGVVIGWGGPVFWPYAYADLVDYTFWPSANDTFWPYAYDDVYDGIFGAYAPDSSAYAYANVPAAGRKAAPRGQIATGVATGLAAGGMAQICSGEASGLTDWPIERIAQQVGPTDAQRSLLDQLKDATAQAVNLMKSACPTDLPSTPTGRLAAMRQRIEPMLQAVQLVRPALDKFYGSLSDEQKERFIALEAEGTPKARATRAANRQQSNSAQACGGSAKQIASLPINQIQQLLHPNDAQRAALEELNNASAQAAALLNENCPPDQALTPPGRVAAMEMRLSAMLKALDTVQPAIAKFYNSLTDEQKARFDRLGPRQS
jgi:LTXXQ motif family protein